MQVYSCCDLRKKSRMLVNLLIILLGIVGIISVVFMIYYHLEFQRACRKGYILSSYQLELLDQKKASSQIIATLSISSAMIIAILKQHYTGG